jgi:uncharacterized protein
MRALRAFVCFAMALPLLPGCGFLKARSDPTRYYVLTSAEPKEPATPAPLVLGIDHVELPDYLMRSELVTRTASNQLAISDYDRWGEPLKEGFARTLRRDLENDLGAGHVIVAPFDPASRPNLTLDLEVRRFERVGSAVVLEASWTIREGKGGATVRTGDSHQQVPLSANSAPATVVALSSALAAFAQEVATAVIRQPQQP